MRYLIAATLLLCAANIAPAADLQPVIVSITIGEHDPARDGEHDRILSEPKLCITPYRQAEFLVGAEVPPPELDIEAPVIHSGTNVVVTCGQPRDGKVAIDLVVRLSSHDELKKDLVAVEQRSVRLVGRIALDKNRRITLSEPGDAVERFAIVRIERAEETRSPRSEIGSIIETEFKR